MERPIITDVQQQGSIKNVSQKGAFLITVLSPRYSRCLRKTGSVDVRRPDAGHKRSVCTPEMEEDILSCVERNPSTSTRAVATAVGTAHSTVWKVLHEQLLHPQAAGGTEFEYG